ncbi:MAG: AAA family ATPase, partial [Clostridia bacterium]|nr:AAA family ATPase [Clostridia bacterium]
MKKLPNGISNYEELIEQNYYYVDKTMYIEKLESLSDKRIMFLRPRKFGKTLFTSMLENYYDILKVDKFENLYGETYIGKNPTKLKNSYHILKFNFSGIDTATEESAIQGFKDNVQIPIDTFVKKYKMDFYINPEQTPEAMLKSLFEAFKIQKPDEKIYVIIDEYDHFANELLGFHTEQFKQLVSKNGKIRKWYEKLKEGTETVVDRIFITGVAPITLDSLTSGFNISNDITRDPRFNNMIGFNKEELITLMKKLEIKEEEQKNILPILKENYDGYQFSTDAEERIYNTNMCLFFLNKYTTFNKIPKDLVDVNIASDYSKLGKMLDLCTNENKQEIIERTLSKEGIATDIVEKFNPEIGFGEREFASMLFYLGYLTIDGDVAGFPILNIPNKIMEEIYSDYFLKMVKDQINIDISDSLTAMA